MGDLVNLRLERKRKARAQAEKDAGARRAAFGRTTAAKTREYLERDLSERKLDGHSLIPRDDGD